MICSLQSAPISSAICEMVLQILKSCCYSSHLSNTCQHWVVAIVHASMYACFQNNFANNWRWMTASKTKIWLQLLTMVLWSILSWWRWNCILRQKKFRTKNKNYGLPYDLHWTKERPEKKIQHSQKSPSPNWNAMRRKYVNPAKQRNLKTCSAGSNQENNIYHTSVHSPYSYLHEEMLSRQKTQICRRSNIPGLYSVPGHSAKPILSIIKRRFSSTCVER